MSVIGVMYTADGNIIELARAIYVAGLQQGEMGTLGGNPLAAHTHQFIATYVTDPEAASASIDRAVEADSTNALPYFLRGMMLSRDFEAMNTATPTLEIIEPFRRDIESAQRLGPEGWTAPLAVLHLLYRNYEGEATFAEYGGFDLDLIEKRPEDWYPYYLAADVPYTATSSVPGLQNAEAGRIFINQALALQPDLLAPYVEALMIDLRLGDLKAAATTMDNLVLNMPNPDVTRDILNVFLSERVADGAISSVFGKYLIGQYEAATQEALAFLLGLNRTTVNFRTGLFLFNGLAHCQRGNYDAANASLDNSLADDSGFVFLLLVKLAVLERMDRSLTSTISRIESRDPDGHYAPYVDAVQRRRLTCDNILDLQALEAAEQAYAESLTSEEATEESQ